MKTSKMQLLAGALVLAALLAVSGVSQASCGSSQRVSYTDAPCVDASYDNNRSCFWGICSTSSTFSATNTCTGKTVVKVDISNQADKTWHLNYQNHGRTGSANNGVNGIYCCKDLSKSGNCSSNPDCSNRFSGSC